MIHRGTKTHTKGAVLWGFWVKSVLCPSYFWPSKPSDKWRGRCKPADWQHMNEEGGHIKRCWGPFFSPKNPSSAVPGSTQPLIFPAERHAQRTSTCTHIQEHTGKPVPCSQLQRETANKCTHTHTHPEASHNIHQRYVFTQMLLQMTWNKHKRSRIIKNVQRCKSKLHSTECRV